MTIALFKLIKAKEFSVKLINYFGDIKQFYNRFFNHSYFILIKIKLLRIITDYNRYMGGVDNFD